MRATAFGAAFSFQLLAEGTKSNRNLLLQGLVRNLNCCLCFCGRRSGRLVVPCVFVEDAQEDTLLHVFLWKTLKLIEKLILCYIFSSFVRLPQKHNGFSVFFRVFHKNTKVSVSPSTSSTKTHGFGLLPRSWINMCTCLCVCACECVYVCAYACTDACHVIYQSDTGVQKKVLFFDTAPSPPPPWNTMLNGF